MLNAPADPHGPETHANNVGFEFPPALEDTPHVVNDPADAPSLLRDDFSLYFDGEGNTPSFVPPIYSWLP